MLGCGVKYRFCYVLYEVRKCGVYKSGFVKDNNVTDVELAADNLCLQDIMEKVKHKN
jgi:hypothetical protein